MTSGTRDEVAQPGPAFGARDVKSGLLETPQLMSGSHGRRIHTVQKGLVWYLSYPMTSSVLHE